MPESARKAEPGASKPSSPAHSSETVPGGETARFHALYHEHFDFVWRSLRLLGVEHASLDDAAQEVFAVMYRGLAEFRGDSALQTWVFAIARRVAANHRRRAQRKQRPLEPLGGDEPSEDATPEAHLEAREAADAIFRYCETLDEERRALFIVALVEGVPAPELAGPLGIPLNTVYSRIRALRQGLERFLAQAEVRP